MTDLAPRIAELAKAHRVVGGCVGVLHEGAIDEFPFGLANIRTGVEVTADTQFLTGSNSKVYTTTLVMQLVDDGLVDLDTPVRKYLPDFRVADADATDAITVRHLLTHTSGIHGDYFLDFGRGLDATQRLVESLADVDQLHPVGELWSYCNAGWVVAGRLIEVLRGVDWASALRLRILGPAELNDTTASVEEAILRRAAVGHIDRGDGEIRVTSEYLLPAAMAAAGSVVASSAADLLRFAHIHIDGGVAGNGKRILSEESARAMQTHQFDREFIAGNPAGGIGLGWMLTNYGSERIIAHGGGTTGQRSFLEVAPDKSFAVTMVTNGVGSDAMWRELAPELFRDRIGVTRTPMPVAPETPVEIDLEKYAGRYESWSAVLTLEVKDGVLTVTAAPRNNPQNPDTPQTPPAPLIPIDATYFLAGGSEPACFQKFGPDGRPEYFFSGRAFRRTA